MIRKVVLLLSWAALAWSCRQEVHFVADAQSRQQIQQDFETKKASWQEPLKTSWLSLTSL